MGILSAISKTFAKAYIKEDGTLSMTMIASDAYTLLGAVILTLEAYGVGTGKTSTALLVVSGILGRMLRGRTSTPMKKSKTNQLTP